MIFAIQRIDKICKELQKHQLSPSTRIDDIVFTPCGYDAYEMVNQSADDWSHYALHQNWGGTDQHHWFRARFSIPADYAGKRVVLLVKTGRTGWDALNPQFLLFINGAISQGLDVNHTEVLIAESAIAGEEYVLDLYAYTGMLDAFTELELQLGVLNTDVEKLFYHLQVPLDVVRLWEENDIQRITILNHLVDAINLLDLRQPGSDAFHASVAAANNLLDTDFYGKYCGDETVNEVCVGHTHIDVAWLWTLAQTREKSVRSFATVIALMKQYPDYIFMSSQAQLYAFVKEDRPDLYEEIKAMIAAGRWEVEGSMWLEADCNLASGESLVRQILHGKRFFKQEFGVENNVLWLPDVFGYSAALPQILRRSGIDYFMTTKISWNEFNKIPYDTFRWKGIDGSDIFTYFISTQDYNPANPKNFTTYNGDTTPTQVYGCWDRYQQKEINTTVLNCFGYGDGGGGPTKPMLERLTRLDKGIPGMPKTRKGKALDFFRDLESRVGDHKRLPEWVGELYLEYHRGTYTSIARNKRYNRKIEYLNREAEWLASMTNLLTGAAYPLAEMDAAWKITLLNQFHDIIPGSSIRQVYEDSQAQYEELFESVGTIGDDAARALAGAIGTRQESVVVFNSLGLVRSDIVKIALPWGWESADIYDGDTQLAVQKVGERSLIFHATDVPPLGYKSFTIRQASAPASANATLPASLENAFFRITLNDDGTIGSLVDKGANREVLLPGARGNLLQAFEDKPFEYDAWNLEIYYQEKMWEISEVSSIELIENGPVRWAVKVVRPFLNSTIEQLYYLYADIARIDFDTTIDWKEHDVVLKAAFPVDVHAEKATYEIQFGNVERPTHWNTSWDWARFEVCAHKWADLSESGYGVSLLNDCKYGHDIRNNTMRLTLLKSATSPNEVADREVHRFVYSLYPHTGGWREGETTQMAYRLNCPLRAEVTGVHDGPLPSAFSYVSADANNVAVEVVKQAEDGGDTIVRLYEYKNQRAPVTLDFGKSVTAAWEVDLMENEVEALQPYNGGISFNVKPYEIRTFKVRF